MLIPGRHYSNEELTPEMIPARDSGLRSLYGFAMTFCGMYAVVGRASRCREIMEKTQTVPRPTLTELRTTLLVILRGWRFMGYPPPDEEMDYLWGLAEKIRERVAAGELE
jgi:hypothetical protein